MYYLLFKRLVYILEETVSRQCSRASSQRYLWLVPLFCPAR